MPLVSPDDEFCAAPRLVIKPGSFRLDDDHEPGYVEGVTAKGGVVTVDDGDATKLISSRLEAVSFEGDGRTISLLDTELIECDLSGLRIESSIGSRLTGCKLVGTEFAGTTVRDVEFVRCAGRYPDFRQALLRRVRFDGCELVEADLFEARLEDVTFTGCDLVKMSVDRVHAERVDLRGNEVDLANVGRLDGWLVDAVQLPTIMYTMAAALGLTIADPT